MNLAQLEAGCSNYEIQSEGLEELIASLESDLAGVKQKHIAKIKRQAAMLARLKSELIAAVESSPELFKRPKTLTIAGVKIGFAASAGRLEYRSEEHTV